MTASKGFSHHNKHPAILLTLKKCNWGSSSFLLLLLLKDWLIDWLIDWFIWVHCSCLQTHQKRASDPITDGCEPSCVCQELNSGPLEEQSVLFTTEPSQRKRFRKNSVWVSLVPFSSMQLRSVASLQFCTVLVSLYLSALNAAQLMELRGSSIFKQSNAVRSQGTNSESVRFGRSLSQNNWVEPTS